MDEATTARLTPVQIEYRRLRSRIFRVVVLFVLVPFGAEAFLAAVSAPPALLSIGMAVTMLGIAKKGDRFIFVVFLYCPK